MEGVSDEMAGNSGGPWGGGSGRGDDDDGNRGGKRPGEGPSVPDIDRIMKKG
jgi:membrane protease subunit HflK